MSEDSDDSRFIDAQMNTSSSQAQPDRHQKPLTGFCSSPPAASLGCALAAITCSQPRQRGSDSEGRFPSSPSDICHSADLRRAALLRSVQMRTHPLGSSSFDLPFGSAQEPAVDDREDYQIECSSMGLSHHDKSCRALNMDEKEEEEDAD